jgi:hypothetical protein
LKPDAARVYLPPDAVSLHRRFPFLFEEVLFTEDGDGV